MDSGQTPLPKYLQTADLLIREIAAGRLPNGTRLKPEREMAAGLGVSVGTLRKALDHLTDKGLLEKVHGSGNYVKKSEEEPGIYGFFRLELVKGGGQPSARVMDVTKLKKPASLPEYGSSEFAHRIRRLRHLSGVPAALEEIWLDGALVEGVAQDELSESLYLFYRERLGLWISRAQDRVGVAEVPAWTTPEFLPRSGTIVGYIERWSRGQDDTVAEYSRTWFDPNVARYVARLQ